MKIMEIEGNKELSGTIRISGAKNATVALIPAAILTDEDATICNVPEITDTDALCDILEPSIPIRSQLPFASTSALSVSKS